MAFSLHYCTIRFTDLQRQREICKKCVKTKRGNGKGGKGGEGFCSIAAVYIYVDFMSVCLSCHGMTEIVRHFFVCLTMRVCVCLLLFSRILYFNKLSLLLFLCFSRSPARISFTVFVLLQQHVMQQTISYTVCALCIPCEHRSY